MFPFAAGIGKVMGDIINESLAILGLLVVDGSVATSLIGNRAKHDQKDQARSSAPARVSTSQSSGSAELAGAKSDEKSATSPIAADDDDDFVARSSRAIDGYCQARVRVAQGQ